MANITPDRVFAAADALEASGSRVSVRSVRDYLGGGSPNQITPLLASWRARKPSVAAPEIQLDPRIVQLIAEQVRAAAGEAAVRNYKKGQEVEAIVLGVDVERERISLGIKQLEDDPFSNYAAVNDKGSIVRGTVKEVDAKGAIIDLGNDIEATLKASEISRDRVEDARNVLKEGDEVEAKIISIDRKSRVISLSIKSKDVEDEKDAMKELRTKQEVESTGPTTIGDLIRAQMENQN